MRDTMLPDMTPDPPAERERTEADALTMSAYPGASAPGGVPPVPGGVPPVPGGVPSAPGEVFALADEARAAAAAPEDLYELGSELLERGEAAEAARVFTAALGQLDPDHSARGRLLGGLGIARLEQAMVAFADAADRGDDTIRPLAVELLARTLPLRDRDEEAAAVWLHGMQDPDPDVASAVRARLRRAFGPEAAAGWDFWWDDFLESAVRHGSLPVLTAELFSAIDQIYALVAVPYLRRARQREVWEALAEAVRVPNGYAWGPTLHDSFRRRLRDVVGTGPEPLPPAEPATG